MAAAAASSRSAASSGEWLMPLGLRMRTMPAGMLRRQDAGVVAGEARDPFGIAERRAQPGIELDAVRARRDGQLGAGGQLLEPGGERPWALRAGVEPQADV